VVQWPMSQAVRLVRTGDTCDRGRSENV
jgi:hypothetical protein